MNVKKIKKMLICSAAVTSILGGTVAPAFASSHESNSSTVTTGTKTGGVINPEDTIVRGNTQVKTEMTPYGSVTMKVTYDRNLTTSTSTITGISSLSTTDTYLALVDKYYSSSSATAQYYDKFHKTNVVITISASECK